MLGALRSRKWAEAGVHISVAPWISQAYSLIFTPKFYYLIKWKKKLQYLCREFYVFCSQEVILWMKKNHVALQLLDFCAMLRENNNHMLSCPSFFEIGSNYAALIGLELFRSDISTCLCLWSAEIKSLYHHAILAMQSRLAGSSQSTCPSFWSSWSHPWHGTHLMTYLNGCTNSIDYWAGHMAQRLWTLSWFFSGLFLSLSFFFCQFGTS